MSEILPAIPSHTEAFCLAVTQGLSAPQKSLPSMYFYDHRGSSLFQQIMQLEAYYLTRAEREVFQQEKDTFLRFFQENSSQFELIELGAGDATKTEILLQHFVEAQAIFTYSPIDISLQPLQQLKLRLNQKLPDLQVSIIHDDYFKALQKLQNTPNIRKIVLFLGANIGNLTAQEAQDFLTQINQNLRTGDRFCIGVDLKKNPQKILHAYNDPQGVTAQFNLNLLRRINEELQANFNLDQFLFHPYYNPSTGEVNSFLVSTCTQIVHIPKANLTVQFAPWETIHTETSKKYTLPEVERLAQKTGFRVLNHLTHPQHQFTNSLWEKI